MGVIQIYITLFGTTIIMASKIENRSSNKGGGMTAPCAWWYTFNLRESPKPGSFLLYRYEYEYEN